MSVHVGYELVVIKGCRDRGCRDRGIRKGDRVVVLAIDKLDAHYGSSVRVTLSLKGRTVIFYARHINRLSEATTRLNDGNPLHVIEVREAKVAR